MVNITRKYKKFINYKDFVGSKVRRYLLYSILSGFLWFLVDTSFVYFIQAFLIELGILSEDKSQIPTWVPELNLLTTVLVGIFLGLFRSFALFLKHFLSGITGQEFARSQRERIIKIGLSRADEVSTSEAVVMFSEISGQAGILINYFGVLMNVFTAAFFILVFGLTIAPYEFIVGLLLFLIFVFPLKALQRKSRKLGKAINQELEKVNRNLIVGLKNNFFLRLHNMVDQEILNANRSLFDYFNLHVQHYLWASLRKATPMFIGLIVAASVTYVSLEYFGTSGVTLLSFFYLFFRFGASAAEASYVFSEIQLHMPKLDALYDWEAKYSRPIEKKNRKLIEVSPKTIVAENLSYVFPDNKGGLSNININLGLGDILVIKGPSGVGKSTLLALLLGLIKPSSGRIKYDNKEIPFDMVSLASAIGYVGAEPYLVEGTIYDNLVYGHPSASSLTMEDINNAIFTAKAVDFINDLKGGLKFVVNDVAQFSTGQKQRLAIARAFLRDPKLLIMDEGTANLDENTEADIVSAICAKRKDRLTIIVTHKNTFDSVATQRIDM